MLEEKQQFLTQCGLFIQYGAVTVNTLNRMEFSGAGSRKAGILPLSWESDINNNVGQASLTAGETQIVSSQLCLELCNLMGELVLKKRKRRGGLNCNDEAVGLQDSFVHEDV
jgi:hypothetical protein